MSARLVSPIEQTDPARAEQPATRDEHRWVGAALVHLGLGENSPRAEHAARTGRHVMPRGTRIEVLEVYCARCRTPYGSRRAELPCAAVVARAV